MREKKLTPDLTIYGPNSGRANSCFNYVVDNRTGVVYLEHQNHYQYGITVMLNADGTPVTIDQLKNS